ncbi:MAG: hotdog fold thioesterase [Halioglobus sp.]
MSNTVPDVAFMQRALVAAPFHQWLGLSVLETGADEIKLSMPWRDEVVSNPKSQSAHGGVLAALIDLTGFYALIATGNMPLATVDLRVDYHQPATAGPLTIVGRVVHHGTTLSVAEASVLSEAGKLLASGRGAYRMSRPSA